MESSRNNAVAKIFKLSMSVLVLFIFEIQSFTKFWILHLHFLAAQLFVRQIVPEALRSSPYLCGLLVNIHSSNWFPLPKAAPLIFLCLNIPFSRVEIKCLHEETNLFSNVDERYWLWNKSLLRLPGTMVFFSAFSFINRCLWNRKNNPKEVDIAKKY